MDYVEKDFGKILKNNAQSLRHDLLPSGTDCFRVYDRNLNRYPVTVDLYGKYAKVTDYGKEPLSDDLKETCLDICSRMLYLEKKNVVYAFRAKRDERKQHEKSTNEAVLTTVKENNLLFDVDLTTYVDTGLFLDHALTRRFIKERSSNKDVLNLFSYTGSFSVYAASGFANTVTSVDMSATYTKWAEKNLETNGFSGDMYKCICMDATKFVAMEIEKGHKYDIIIFDPPSFSNSRKMEEDFDVMRDYINWIFNLSKILKKTGFILFSTNLGSFKMDKRRLRNLCVKEVSEALSAPGFVKGRLGTTRSWIMAFDEQSLSLDWSEPEKKSEKSSDTREKSGKRRSDSERREYGKRDFHRDSRRTSYAGTRRERSEDRPYRNRFEDRPYREKSERRDSYRDSSHRFSQRREESNNYERSERRSFNGGRRNFNREERRPFGEERRSSFRDNKREDRKRSFDDNRRNQRSFDRDRKPINRESKKPFGYDSFKPARSRDDSAEFFWNKDDLDPRPKNKN